MLVNKLPTFIKNMFFLDNHRIELVESKESALKEIIAEHKSEVEVRSLSWPHQNKTMNFFYFSPDNMIFSAFSLLPCISGSFV